MISHTVSIIYDDSFWIALFEMNDENGYSVAREVIGTSEPTGSDIYLFFSQLNYNRLRYTLPSLTDVTTLKQHNISYKKMQKKIKREEQTCNFKYAFTKAQSKLKKQFIENKIQRKKKRRDLEKIAEEQKHKMKELKRKEKHKGH